MHRARWTFNLLIAALMLAPNHLSVTGQEPNTTEATLQTEQIPTTSQQVPIEIFATPRAALGAYFEAARKADWDRAALSLDFSELDNPTFAERATYAYQLKAILDRIHLIPWNNPDLDYEVGNRFEVPTGTTPALIVVDRSADGGWRFSTETVANIDSLFEKFRDQQKVAGMDEIERFFLRFSPQLLNVQVLLPTYQWVCLLIVIFVGFLIDLLVRLVLKQLTAAWFHIFRQGQAHAIKRRIWKPVGLLCQVLVWYSGTVLIGFPPLMQLIVVNALKFFAVIAGVWTTFLLIELLAAYIATKAAKTETKFDDLLVPLISKSLKVFTVAIGVLVCAETFNLPITGLLGGIGLGGMAIAFASKDAIANLFGSITVLVDRPFEIGDWVIADGIEGTVESVGFRSTRIRTFYSSQITLPNSRLTTAIVDNMGRRHFRRIKEVLGLQYDTTPEQIDAFCEGVRELIRRHPFTRKDYYHVYFNGYGDSSLNILLYCFVDCSDWSVELRETHRLFNDILRLGAQLGVNFAFPTRTLHLYQEKHGSGELPIDVSRADQAGQRIGSEIAGPLMVGAERPGPVSFTGPSNIDDAQHGDDGA
ncbi:MAG: mechanosensitive ion channel family protein [Pirellulaceae bacterium]|nr:mechanosensitive ion channel family protein [Pirellulaceae bacterium]